MFVCSIGGERGERRGLGGTRWDGGGGDAEGMTTVRDESDVWRNPTCYSA